MWEADQLTQVIDGTIALLLEEPRVERANSVGQSVIDELANKRARTLSRD